MLGRILLCCCAATVALAYNAPADSAGSLTARIDIPPASAWNTTGKHYPLTVTVSSGRPGILRGTAELRGIDGWIVSPKTRVPFRVSSKQRAALKFSVTMPERTFAAHYPIHAYVRIVTGKKTVNLHAIAIVETHVENPPIAAGWTNDQSGGSLAPLPERMIGEQVRVTPGGAGLLDSTVSFLNRGKNISFRGFRVRSRGQDLTSSSVLDVRDESAGGRYRLRHLCAGFDLLAELWTEGGAFRTRFWLENTEKPKPWRVVYLEDVSLGPWNVHAKRVYAGQGNVIENPEPFRLTADGHKLATSYVGFDFPGMSILQAVDTPPDSLEVNPAQQLYTLHTPHAQTVTLIAAPDVWQAALAWRHLDTRIASGGVRNLAGRFVFDVWSGNYHDSALAVRSAIEYGLTDSVLIFHNWQRWGYDYRLPDIYPPNPDLGSMDEFLDLANTTRRAGILFAPHDNYIDYYPDSENFTYNHVAFKADGSPFRAWLNRGRDAQSYRARADHVREYVERNVKLMRRDLTPNAYFIDVWSSIEPYDQWTSDGRFIDRTVTRQVWSDSFRWIRNYLGNNAPQISEAGNDSLVGALDGATCVHLRVAAPPLKDMVWSIRAQDSERIPWLDLVHHDRFILHGAGYEGRYDSGQDARLHGVGSDDYIATEVLTGHPAMVNSIFSRDTVRQYWLLHDVMGAVALRRMVGVSFEGDNIHRQRVQWEREGDVAVNRGEQDWTVDSHVLPQYGYYARIATPKGYVESAIERKDGLIVEWSQSPDNYYVNARPVVTDGAGPDPRTSRMNPEGRLVYFGAVTTNGALRIEKSKGTVVVLPLPGGKAFDAQIRWKDVAPGRSLPQRLDSLDENRNVLKVMPVALSGDLVILHVEPGVFAYQLR